MLFIIKNEYAPVQYKSWFNTFWFFEGSYLNVSH